MDATVSDLYDLSNTSAAEYLAQFDYPWEALAGIGEFILKLGATLPEDEYYHPLDEAGNPKEDVWVSYEAKVFPSAYLNGPLIIEAGAEVRQCAFIRGKALVGKGVVVGNSTELKNVILFDNVQVPHYNYVGDSILGFGAHMGAGAVTSNLKSDRSPVIVKDGDQQIETGIKKFGAMLGDGVEVGCNSVLNPGTVIGRGSRVYPLSSVRGFVPANRIFKDRDHVVVLEG